MMRHGDEQIERAATRFAQLADDLDPEAATMVDTGDLRQVATASRTVRADEVRLRQVVAAAREAGRSWNQIGVALGVSRQAARLQQAVPDAVLVGGSAAAWYAGHRLSSDHDCVRDRVPTDLRDRFDAVLEAVEATDGRVTNRVTPHRIILGRLGDVEAGVSQLCRTRPLDVAEVVLPSGATLRVPTPDETLRVKAYLITARNRVRDFLDVAALTERAGTQEAAQVLVAIDDFDQQRQLGASGALRALLAQALPGDLVALASFDALGSELVDALSEDLVTTA